MDDYFNELDEIFGTTLDNPRIINPLGRDITDECRIAYGELISDS